MKQCRKCGVIKSLDDFSRHKNNKDGRQAYCKKCQVEANKKCPSYKIYRNYPRMKTERYGISGTTIYKLGLKLALYVYDRAGRKCEQCGSEFDLTIHHKDHRGRNYTNVGLKPNNKPNNLIILCRKCHGSLHGKDGGKIRWGVK